MDVKLNKISEIWVSLKSDHKMTIFLDIKSRDQFTTLMMEAKESSDTLYTCTDIHDIVYQET
jgi:hypothetical protein